MNYKKDFVDLIYKLHQGRESLPQYEEWIKGHLTRVDDMHQVIIPQIKRFTELKGKNILDFGSGTGATCVTLAMNGADVTGIEPDLLRYKGALLRIRDHGLSSCARVLYLPDTSSLPFKDESFDVCVCNAVLEHIPKDREVYIKEMWRVLKNGGLLFVAETPNRLFPKDSHTTGLWFVPYMSPKLAKKYAVWRGKATPELDLETSGIHGSTYWQIIKPLDPDSFIVMNNCVEKCDLTFQFQSWRITQLPLWKRTVKYLKFCIGKFISVSLRIMSSDIPLAAFFGKLTICLKKVK